MQTMDKEETLRIGRRRPKRRESMVGFSFGLTICCCCGIQGVLGLTLQLIPSRGDVVNTMMNPRIIPSWNHRHSTSSTLKMTKDNDDEYIYLDDDDDDDDDDEDDEDDEPPEVDVSKFVQPKSTFAFGLNRGRSAPSQRKAMGTSGTGSTSVHVCTNCGSEFVKWMGRCPTCREWNTLQEFKVDRGETFPTRTNRPTFSSRTSSSSSWLDGTNGDSDYSVNEPVRVTDVYKEIQKTTGDGSFSSSRGRRIQVPGDEELNTVLGGGIMSGSLILMGGAPGVGKSTLLLQTAGSVASLSQPTRGIGMGMSTDEETLKTLGPVWYISGEENAEQIASRAARLGIDESELFLLSETHVDTLAEQVVASYQQTATTTPEGEVIPGQVKKPPALLVVDSIQTMICEAGGASAAGGVTQVRECVALFLRLAKSTGIPVILVGHVTKSGDVAGPRTVEHMVDCVLYLEGGDTSTIGGVNLRMLRAAKNRFGSADEVAVYEMTAGRLCPVSDPSSLFLSNRIESEDSEGCSIALVVEGLRAMTVEVQALVTPVTSTGSGYGRRTVDGIAHSRLLLLLGVLQKRCGMFFSKQDVYINVVGRMRLDRGSQEGSASDLAVAVSLVSSFVSIPVRADTAFVGEIGLLGELRPVPALEKRLQEARRMGFSRIITPRAKDVKQKSRGSTTFFRANGIEWIQCDRLLDAINEGLVAKLPKDRKRRRKSAIKGEDGSDGTGAPGNLNDLMLDNVITDDDDYDDDAQGEDVSGMGAPGNLNELMLDNNIITDDDDDLLGNA